MRGTAQNPDVYFQARETVNPFYARGPEVVEEAMRELGERTGRRLHLVDYSGDPEAERVIVIMGSGGRPSRDRGVARRRRRACRRLAGPALQAVPRAGAPDAPPGTVRSIAVLDRTKEPGSIGELLYLDTVAALYGATTTAGQRAAAVIGGRYGLSSKEFTPGMAAGVFAELAAARPRRHFTIGIDDDVSGTSPPYDRPRHRAARDGARDLLRPRPGRHGRREQEHDQDPRRGRTERAGLLRLRLEEVRPADPSRTYASAPNPIRAPYLVQHASFVGCHQFGAPDRRTCRPRPGGRHPPIQQPARTRAGLGGPVSPRPGADHRQAH